MKTVKQTIWIMMVMGIVWGCEDDNDPVSPTTSGPRAAAGADREAELGSLVKLDASASSDPQGDPLTYNWSFMSKPQGSGAAIVGVGKEQAEFTLDKAGEYVVQLKVSDGTFEATDSVSISNRTPVLSDVNTSTFGFSEDLMQKGLTINIYGEFFSGDINENQVSIADIECEIIDIDISDVEPDKVTVRVPDEAVSGDLKITVRTKSVVWIVPLRLASRLVEEFINSDNTLMELQRSTNGRTDYKEIGTRFKPLVNGTEEFLYVRLPRSQSVRVTLWDASSKVILASEFRQSWNNGNIPLTNPVPLEAGKEYLISINANDWFLYLNDPRKPIYPTTINDIEILGAVASEGTTDQPPSSTFPEEEVIVDYITRGADVVFARDVAE